MGRLIKASGRLVPAAVLSAKDEAAQVLAAARAERESARRDAEAIRLEAEQRGYRQGFERGQQEGLAACTRLLAAAQVDADARRAQAKDTAVILARRMAERIVGRAVELSPETMADIVSTALTAARARAGSILLRVHPLDVPTVEAHRARWLAALNPGEVGLQVRVAPDETVDRHGCIVETPVGRLDARLTVQLDALERALLG
jgi:flagellar biosynthesis/type III secretory pathway protein FliH